MKFNKKTVTLLLACLLLLGTVGGTVAFLIDSDGPVENTFQPSEIDTEIVEEFDGSKKENIRVKNVGDTDGFFRVKLVSYWYDSSDRITAKDSWFSDDGLTLGESWIKGNDGYYYYALPIAPNAVSETALFTTAINLIEDDEDETKQVLEVLADGIQSVPKEAFEAWASGSGITWAKTKLSKS